MKKIIQIKLLLFLYYTHLITINIENIELPNYRIRNFVICNDVSEFYIKQTEFPLPWNIKSNNSANAISTDLLHALSAQQLVLCTKLSWHNVQFLAQLWQDFATQSKEFLINKYQQISRQYDSEFLTNLNIYQPAIKEIQRLYQIINGIITTHISNPSVISDQIDKAMASSFATNPEWLKQGDLNKNLQSLFTIYTLYQLTIANNYLCKEINDTFILFIPPNLIKSSLNPELINVTKQQDITSDDIYVGLRYKNCKNYNYLIPFTIEEAKSLSKTITTTEELSQHLVQTLDQLIIKKTLLRTPFQDYTSEILPNFNILLIGHGSKDIITAGISVELKNRTKTYTTKSPKTGKEETKQYNYTSSDFLDILNLFNNQLFMKSLTISSCYPAGKKIKETFNMTSKLNNQKLERLNYPIILLGTVFAPIYTNSWITLLPPFKKLNLQNYLYLEQKKYGPYKQDGQETFVKFFNFLNQTTFNTNYSQQSTQTFSQSHPSFIQAANVFSQALDETADKIDSNKLESYVFIKFPHTSWFTPARFKEHVLTLSQVATLTKQTITLKKDIQVVLIDANLMPTKIIIPYEIPSFIPINYINQNYVFDQITIQKKVSLEKFLEHFFKIEDIKEPINIVIKNLFINTDLYTNIYIFIYNDFGSEGIRNGYLYTNNNSQTNIVHWPSNLPFQNQAITKSYLESDAQKLLKAIEKNANKPSNKSEQSTNTNTLKYEVEKTSAIDSSNIQNLEINIATLKNQNISQLQKNQEQKSPKNINQTKWDKQHYPSVQEQDKNAHTAKESKKPTLQIRSNLIQALELATLIK